MIILLLVGAAMMILIVGITHHRPTLILMVIPDHMIDHHLETSLLENLLIHVTMIGDVTKYFP